MAKGKLPEGIIWRTINGARVAINPKTGMAVAGAGGRLKGVTLNWYDDMGPMPSHLRGASKPAPARPSKSLSLVGYRASQADRSKEDPIDQFIDSSLYGSQSPNIDAITADAKSLQQQLLQVRKRASPEVQDRIDGQLKQIQSEFARTDSDWKKAEYVPDGQGGENEEFPAVKSYMRTKLAAEGLVRQETLRQITTRNRGGGTVQDAMPKPKTDPRKKFEDDAAARKRRTRQIANEKAAAARGPRTRTRMTVDGQDAYITKNTKKGVEITTVDGKVYQGSSVDEIMKRVGVKVERAPERLQISNSAGYVAAQRAAKATGGQGDPELRARRAEVVKNNEIIADRNSKLSSAYNQKGADRYLTRRDQESIASSMQTFSRQTAMADSAAEQEWSQIQDRLRRKVATQGDRTRVRELQRDARDANDMATAKRDLKAAKALASEYPEGSKIRSEIEKLAPKIESGKATVDDVQAFNAYTRDARARIYDVRIAKDQRVRSSKAADRAEAEAAGYEPPKKIDSPAHRQRMAKIEKAERLTYETGTEAELPAQIKAAEQTGLDLTREKAAHRAAITRAGNAYTVEQKKEYLARASRIAADMDKKVGDHLYKLTTPREDPKWKGSTRDGGKKRIVSFVGDDGKIREEKGVIYGDFAVISAGRKGAARVWHVPTGAVMRDVTRKNVKSAKAAAATLVKQLNQDMAAKGTSTSTNVLADLVAGLTLRDVMDAERRTIGKAYSPDEA